MTILLGPIVVFSTNLSGQCVLLSIYDGLNYRIIL